MTNFVSSWRTPESSRKNFCAFSGERLKYPKNLRNYKAKTFFFGDHFRVVSLASRESVFKRALLSLKLCVLESIFEKDFDSCYSSDNMMLSLLTSLSSNFSMIFQKCSISKHFLINIEYSRKRFTMAWIFKQFPNELNFPFHSSNC